MNATNTEGCEDPAVAYQRAAKLVADVRGNAESFWSRKAQNMDIINTADGTPVKIEPGSLKSEVDALVTGLRDRRYGVVETRLERLRLAAGRYARHAPSALILYAAPAAVVFVVARALRLHVRGGAR